MSHAQAIATRSSAPVCLSVTRAKTTKSPRAKSILPGSRRGYCQKQGARSPSPGLKFAALPRAHTHTSTLDWRNIALASRERAHHRSIRCEDETTINHRQRDVTSHKPAGTCATITTTSGRGQKRGRDRQGARACYYLFHTTETASDFFICARPLEVRA